MALNSLYCADVQISNYSLTHSLSFERRSAKTAAPAHASLTPLVTGTKFYVNPSLRSRYFQFLQTFVTDLVADVIRDGHRALINK